MGEMDRFTLWGGQTREKTHGVPSGSPTSCPAPMIQTEVTLSSCMYERAGLFMLMERSSFFLERIRRSSRPHKSRSNRGECAPPQLPFLITLSPSASLVPGSM